MPGIRITAAAGPTTTTIRISSIDLLGVTARPECNCSVGQRVHIVGISPRAGTTLLAELMVSCFKIEGFSEHETSIFEMPDRPYQVYCSKKPADLNRISWPLRLDRSLWVVNLVRDPRDVVVSKHGLDPERYWAPLRIWKSRSPIARRLDGRPRYLNIKYEDLVRRPDATQQALIREMPFLEPVHPFSAFREVATPAERALEALGELRPPDTGSIGSWRRHKPRLAGQLEIHGGISKELVEWGYEQDEEWLRELDGVEPDLTPSHLPELGRPVGLRKRIARGRQLLRYVAGAGMSEVTGRRSDAA